MGCGSSSLKGTQDAGTDLPSVPATTGAATGAPMKKVATNFSTVDYDAPKEPSKNALLKDQAPDEHDEGPSRNASHVSPLATRVEEPPVPAAAAATAGTGTGLQSEAAMVEEEKPAESAVVSEAHPAGGKVPDFVQ